jgi:glycosyltransferase involved in cell wall biosynthesis
VQRFPLVSVIVPTRDRPHLLRRAVASILNQDYPGEIECLVVFDQSKPEPIDVELPERRRLRSIVNDRTPGLAGARNAGIGASVGELIGFCDDDDVWLPAKARVQSEALGRAGNAEVVACGIYVSRGGRDWVRRPAGDALTFDDFLRSRRMEIHPGTIIARRSAFLDTVGLVDEAIPGSYAEDYEWLLRATRLAPILVVQEPFVRVYWNRRSWFTGRWATLASALQYLLAKYPEFAGNRVGLARLYGQIAFALAASKRPSEARAYAWRSLQLDPRQPRLYLSLLVSLRLVRADTVVRAAALVGKGI